MTFDPSLDLELTRLFAAPPAKVWRCWTDPALLCQWWTPRPVITREAVIEPRPGGRFFTIMVLPDGSEIAGDGCILEAVPEQRIAFTDLLMQDWQPVAKPGLGFTAIITLAAEGTGTRYTALARHRSPEERKLHEEMGFHQGWGTAADQLGQLCLTV